MTAPEFSRPLRIDAIGEAPRAEHIAADIDECAALARRFGLVAIERLVAKVSVRRDGDSALAEGRITATVVQRCAATGEALTADIAESFSLRFVPQDAMRDVSAEVELDALDCDTVPYAGGAIDLGEAAAETLLLALDPFPRAPDADAALAEAGVTGDGEAGPFAALTALKERLGRPA